MIVVTSRQINLTDLVADLVEKHPEIVTVAVNLNTSKSSEIYGEKTQIIWGQETIREGVLDYEFSLSPRAFYQLNPEQTEVLYSEAVKALDVSPEDHLIDAYCGVGTIGFAFADKVKSVRGWILSLKRLRMPSTMLSRWDLLTPTMKLGRLRKLFLVGTRKAIGQMQSLWIHHGQDWGVQLIDTLLRYAPQKMVYVSCNVSTLARDLVDLTKVYDVVYIQSVDMFPHTARTEAVVKLVKKA